MVAIKMFGLLVVALVGAATLYIVSKKLEADRVRVKSPARGTRQSRSGQVPRLRQDPVTGVYRPE